MQRNRWGLIAICAYLPVMGIIKFRMLASGRQVALDDALNFALVTVVPISCMYVYVLAVFTYGLSGDLAARQSMYPARMLTLPVPTARLAGLPMLYGAIATALLWAAARVLTVWPPEFEAPVIWPALLLMAFLAWSQALTWMPYGLPGVRVIVTLLCLAVIETIVIVGLHFKTGELVMSAFLLPQVPLAYLLARVAVARARRGEVPDWRPFFAGIARTGTGASTARPPFATPARAQAWFEWRRHGLTLPVWVGILLPVELVLLWVAGDARALVFAILTAALLTPTVMAAFAAASVRKMNPDARDSLGVSPFIATRPLTDAELIAAKLKATLWSTVAAWLLVLAAIPVALLWSDTWPVVADQARRFSAAVGTPRAVVVTLLVLALLIASTWKQLVQTLWVGLTGRAWVVNTSIVLALLLLTAVGPTLVWLVESARARVALWDALPSIMTVLMCVKVAAAAWIVTQLHRGRFVSDRTLVTGAVIWLVSVLALYVLLVWLLGTPMFPRHVLALIAILAIPLGRLSAAPMALAWNRHR